MIDYVVFSIVIVFAPGTASTAAASIKNILLRRFNTIVVEIKTFYSRIIKKKNKIFFKN